MNEILGKMREWIQRKAINGSSVIWGSTEVLRFTTSLTVLDLETLALELTPKDTRPSSEIQERLNERVKVADKIRGFLDNPEDNYDLEDLIEELKEVKQDIRTLKWVMKENKDD
jgi:hypothetical protein